MLRFVVEYEQWNGHGCKSVYVVSVSRLNNVSQIYTELTTSHCTGHGLK